MEEEYLQQLFNYIGSVDPSFKDSYSLEGFTNDMQDKKYAAEMYNYIGGIDETFKANYTIEGFLNDVTIKKKDSQLDGEPMEDTVSPIQQPQEQDTSSDLSLAETYQQFQEPETQIPFRPEEQPTEEEGVIEYDVSKFTSEELERQDKINAAKKEFKDLFGFEPRDMRETGYVPPQAPEQPTTGLGGVSDFRFQSPSDMDDDERRNQIAADQAFTTFMVELEEPELSKLQAQEKAQRQAKINTAVKGREEILKDSEFNEALNATDLASIQTEENEAVDYFNNLYGKYGFTFRPIGLGDAMEVTQTLSDGNVVRETIDLDTWFDSNALTEAEKLKKFVTNYAYKPDERAEKVETNSVQSAIRAKYLRDVPRINDDGTESTVLFESANIDGKEVVYPTLFLQNPEVKSSDPMYWMELEGMEAFEEAKKRGELFYFDDEKEANEFAQGSWKDVSNVDAEADRFFAERGYDYLSMKNQIEEYEDARDKVFFIQSLNRGTKDQRGFDINELSESEQEEFSDFYTAEGKLRADYKDIYEDSKKRFDELADVYLDSDLQKVREDYDVFIDKQLQSITQEAVQQRAASKYIDNELNTASFANFGLSIDELVSYEPTNQEEASMQDAILTAYQSTQEVSKMAADKYEVAETYLDSKFDQDLRGEIVENYASFQNSIKEGLNRGKAGDIIIQQALGITGDTTEELAEKFVEYMRASNTGKVSRELNRYHSAKGFREAFDAFSDDIPTMAMAYAANSLSQMLPYGLRLLLTAVPTGVGIGAGAGTVAAGPLGTIPGAATGLAYGLRTAMMGANYGMEYTNAMMEAMNRNDYNVLNPDDVAAAFKDDNVWKEGRKQGLLRGIPIMAVDIISAGIAGRVFNVGKTASLGRRVSAFTAERLAIDPLLEGAGEYLAQVSYNKGIDMKEVFAEMIGGLGNNASFAAINKALDLRAKNNLDLANEFTTIEALNKELSGVFGSTPKRVSNWANKMEKLGQITKATNQRIQLNLGQRQNAQNVLSATEGNVSRDVLNRTMQLMSAKEELTSTTNRKEIFGDKIRDINTEIKEIAETKTLRKPSERTSLEGIGPVVGQEQTTETDIRKDVRGKYKINGKKYKRKKFLNKISDMSDKQVLAADIIVENDEQVVKTITEKFSKDAIQEQETRAVSDDKQTGDIQAVESEVRTLQEEQAAEPTTVEEGEVVEQVTEEVVIPDPITRPTKKDVTAFDDNTIEESRLDGIVSAIADKQIEDKKLTPFQARVAEKNQSRVDDMVSLKTKPERLADLEATIELESKRKLGEVNFRLKEDDAVVQEDDTKSEVVYHGSPTRIEGGVLKRGQSGAIFLTPNRKYAEQYSADKVGEVTEIKISEQKKKNLFDLRKPEHVERLKEGFLKNNEELEIEYDTKEDALRDYDNAIRSMREASEGREGINDWSSGSQFIEAMENAGFEGALFAERPAGIVDEDVVISYALFEKQIPIEAIPSETKTAVETVEGRADVEAIVEEMNKQDEGAVIETTEVRETKPEAPKIDVDEINSRVDNPIPTVEWKVIDGVPVIFNVSDQLRTGDVVNPLTGTVIENLKGGMGFVGIDGHENIAWASVSKDKVKTQLSSAISVYENNRAFFDSWWKANPEYNGLVPMVIVKMAENSITSNESVARVLLDNIKTLPIENRKAAMVTLKEELNKKLSLLKDNPKKIKPFNKINELIKKNDFKVIDDIISEESIKQLPLPARAELITLMTGGSITEAGGKPKNVNKINKASKAVVQVLMKGFEDQAEIVNIGRITDLLTEPQLKDAPVRSAFMITGVDVLSAIDNKEGSIVETNHPNYPVGPKGKVIGVIEQPQSIVELFPSMYNNIILGLEKEQRGERKQRTEDQRLAQTLPVQMGLNNLDYVGTRFGIDNVGRFMDFINRSFPFMNISTDQETMNTALMSPRVTAYLKKGDVVYGLTADNQILINSEVHNSESDLFNTAIHEMGHVWVENLKLTPRGRKIYNRGAQLVKQTKTYEKFLKKFDGDVDKAVDEAMAVLIGNKGESVVEASLKQKIKDWIASLWSYVKDNFKLSKDLTTEDIQNLNLDSFLESAVADILKGKPIDISDKNLNKLTEGLGEVLFRADESIDEIVRIGRENEYKEADIREILVGRGFKKADIDRALTYNIDLFTELPIEFGRIEGGVKEAAQMFTDIKLELDRFATSGRANVIGRRRIKSFAEIRQKAQDLIQEHNTYKSQNDQVQMELRVGLDRALGYRGGRNVSREISKLKEALRQRRIGADNLKQAQLMLRNFIRRNLPESKTYSQAQINRLLNSVTGIKTVDDYYKQSEKVVKIIEEKRAQIKRDVIKEIYKVVKSKATPALVKGKRKAKGIDAIGQVIFNNIKRVMNAVTIRDNDKRAQEINNINIILNNKQPIIDAAQIKLINGEEITLEEESLIQLQLAFDQFAGLDTASLEEAQQLLKDVKLQKKESILRFNTRRLKIAEDRAARSELATNQIRQTDPLLFNEDGTPKNTDQLNQAKDNIKADFSARGIMKKVYDKISKNIFGRTDSPFTKAKNVLTNLETITNFLDRKNKGLTVFTDYVYRNLNRKSELLYQRKNTMRKMVDKMAEESGFETGLQGVEIALDKVFGFNLRGLPKTMEIMGKSKAGTKTKYTFNGNQLLRIYALSKNAVQYAKLEKQGFTDKVLKDIETKLGPDLISFADKAVEYLSTTGFNEVNSVYKQVNGVNLGYVSNYFPTKTINVDITKDMIDSGDFSSTFAEEFNSALLERTDRSSDINVKEGTFTGVFMNHLESMEKYKTYAADVQELNSFFNTPVVKTLLKESGSETLLKVFINAEINPQAASQALGIKETSSFDKILRAFSGYALGFKLIQILKQATSIANAFAQYSFLPPSVESKLPRLVTLPIDMTMFTIDVAGMLLSMPKDMFGYNGPITKARKMSASFNERIIEGLEGDIYGLESGSQTLKLANKKSSYWGKAVETTKALSARPTVIGDIMGVMGYYVNYKRNIANGMTEAEALEAFNNYNSTQQSRRATDKTLLQLQGDWKAKVFTMFGSTTFLQMNKVMQSSTNIMRSWGEVLSLASKGEFKKAKSAQPTKQDYREFYMNLAIANVLFTGASNIMLLTRGNDKDRDLFVKRVMDAAFGLNILYNIPMIGVGLEMGINSIRGDRKPVETVTNPILSLAYKIKKRATDNPDAWFRNFILPILEMRAGFQVDPFVGLSNAIQDGYFGRYNEEEYYNNMYDIFGISKSYRPGYGQKGSDVEGIIPIGGIKTKSDLKRYDPRLYEKVYGRYDEMMKEQREREREILEKMGYKKVGGKLYPLD